MAGSIPTEADWRNEPWVIDTPCAYEHFAGKSSDEAVALFEYNALCYQEDVMFMPDACFAFYAGAYMAYLMSEASEGDSDGASCFFDLVEIRAEEISKHRGFASAVKRMLEHLSTRQDWYDADVSIYGSFTDRAKGARKKLESQKTGT